MSVSRSTWRGKQTVDFTIEVAKACAAAGVPVTMALQAYLKRTLDDLDNLPDHREHKVPPGQGRLRRRQSSDIQVINESYKLLVQALTYLAKPYCVATHDPEILDWMKFSGTVDTDKTEFSFLKGLADQTKLAFVKNKLYRLGVRSVRQGERTLHRSANEVSSRPRRGKTNPAP